MGKIGKTLLDPLGLFDKPSVTVINQPPPEVTPPTEMPTPTPTDATVQAAKRRSLKSQLQRRGRASTILSDITNEPLGGV